MRKCGKAGCAGLTFADPKCDGSDDEEGMHHCVHCGELVWEDKGARCDRCGDYWCQGGWQNTFVFLDCECAEEEADEEMLCVDCFLAAPTLWCEDEACDCAQKQARVRKSYGKYLAAGELCGSIELAKDAEHFCVKVNRFPKEESRALLRVIDGDQKTSTDFSGPDAIERACAEATRLARERIQHGFKPSIGMYGGDCTYGYLKGFK